jgi:hypothetical protein
MVAPRKLMWTNWTIQSGKSLTSGPEQNFAHMEVTKYVKPKGWRIVGHNESEGMKLRNRKQLHRAKVSTSLKPVSLHALIGECVSGVPESKTMAGNSTVHIGTWENRIAPCKSFQQAEEARRKYGDTVVGLTRSRGVGGVMPIESREPGTLEGVSSKMQRDEKAGAIL